MRPHVSREHPPFTARECSDPVMLGELEKRVRAWLASSKPTDQRARIADLQHQVSNIADAIARGSRKSSPVLAKRLILAEGELARLNASAERRHA
jgi:hypothetical protein